MYNTSTSFSKRSTSYVTRDSYRSQEINIHTTLSNNLLVLFTCCMEVKAQSKMGRCRRSPFLYHNFPPWHSTFVKKQTRKITFMIRSNTSGCYDCICLSQQPSIFSYYCVWRLICVTTRQWAFIFIINNSSAIHHSSFNAFGSFESRYPEVICYSLGSHCYFFVSIEIYY